MFQAIRTAKETADAALGYTDFIKLAGLLMVTGNSRDALEKAEEVGASDRVKRVLKAVQAGGVTGNTGISNYGSLVGAFIDNAKNYGALDRVAADATGRVRFTPKKRTFVSALSMSALCHKLTLKECALR